MELKKYANFKIQVVVWSMLHFSFVTLIDVHVKSYSKSVSVLLMLINACAGGIKVEGSWSQLLRLNRPSFEREEGA